MGILTNVALDPDVMNNTVSVSITVCYVSTGTLNLGDTVTIDGELQHGSVTDSPQSTSLTVAAGTPTATVSKHSTGIKLVKRYIFIQN